MARKARPAPAANSAAAQVEGPTLELVVNGERVTIADRVKELRRVRAGDLIPHPKNWRLHDAGQRSAFTGLLQETGFADALKVRELPDGRLQVLDGHMRADLD